ncbi:MAG: SDR family oxidoreductase [Methylococcales bacterium]
MKKVVVLGALGMAGHVMAEYLDSFNEYEIIGVARNTGRNVAQQLDALNFGAVERYLVNVKPDIVINCIGMLVQQSESNVANAILINSYLPHFLSELGSKLDFKLIHISTDCVFSGKAGQYNEDAFKDGDDAYARTKSLGEVINAKDLTIRTSIIGPELKKDGTGLLDWFFKQSGEIKGYTQAYWSGVTTLELAKATHEMIKQNITGLYHLCPEHKISKYDLVCLFSKIWNKEITIIPFDQYIVDKSLICTRKDFNYHNLDYMIMLNELKQWIGSRSADYAINAN